MATIEVSTVIDRPVEEVFAFAIDPEKTTLWQTGVVEHEQTSEGPMGVGTTLRGVGHFLGRRIESIEEITHYEPNRKVVAKTISGPMELAQSNTYEPVGGGTRVTFTLEGETGGFFKMAEPLVIRMAKREYEKSLANLKDLLESQA